MNEYELLIYKSELAAMNARKANSDWATWYWQDVSDKLKEKAYSLNVGAL